MRATAAEQTQTGGLVLLSLASWAIPGAGHLWLGRRSKGFIFLIALPLMFALGLRLQGRLFPFDTSEPLVCLAALADLGEQLPLDAPAAVLSPAQRQLLCIAAALAQQARVLILDEPTSSLSAAESCSGSFKN